MVLGWQSIGRIARLAIAALAALMDKRGLCLQLGDEAVRGLVESLSTFAAHQQENVRLAGGFFLSFLVLHLSVLH